MDYIMFNHLCFIVFFFSSRRRHTRCALVTGVQTCALPIYDMASIHLNADERGIFAEAAHALKFSDEEGAMMVKPQSLLQPRRWIGRASCRERVCQYV